MDNDDMRDTTQHYNKMRVEGRCEEHGYKWCYLPDHPRTQIGCPVCANEKINNLLHEIQDLRPHVQNAHELLQEYNVGRPGYHVLGETIRLLREFLCRERENHDRANL